TADVGGAVDPEGEAVVDDAGEGQVAEAGRGRIVREEDRAGVDERIIRCPDVRGGRVGDRGAGTVGALRHQGGELDGGAQAEVDGRPGGANVESDVGLTFGEAGANRAHLTGDVDVA